MVNDELQKVHCDFYKPDIIFIGLVRDYLATVNNIVHFTCVISPRLCRQLEFTKIGNLHSLTLS